MMPSSFFWIISDSSWPPEIIGNGTASGSAWM